MPKPDVVQIDDKKPDNVVVAEPNEKVSGMQVGMENPGLVHAGYKLAKLTCQPLAYDGSPCRAEGGQRRFNKLAEGLRILKAARDKIARDRDLSRREPVPNAVTVGTWRAATARARSYSARALGGRSSCRSQARAFIRW